MTPAQKLLADIREKQAHWDRLLRKVAVCAAVQTQGIAVNAVDHWGFDSSLLTPGQAADAHRAVLCGRPYPYTGQRLDNGRYAPKVYNYVRLKDGSRVRPDPMLEAV